MGVQIAVKNWQNLPISNPKQDLHNINAHTKFGENPLTFTQVLVRKWKYISTYDRERTNDRQADGHMDNQCTLPLSCGGV